MIMIQAASSINTEDIEEGVFPLDLNDQPGKKSKKLNSLIVF